MNYGLPALLVDDAYSVAQQPPGSLVSDVTTQELPAMPEMDNASPVRPTNEFLTSLMASAIEEVYGDSESSSKFDTYLKNLEVLRSSDEENLKAQSVHMFLNSIGNQMASDVSNGVTSIDDTAELAGDLKAEAEDPEFMIKHGSELLGVDHERASQMLQDYRLSKYAQEHYDSKEGVDFALEFAKSFVPFRDTALNYELFESLGFSDQEAFVRAYRTFDAPTQAKLFDELTEALKGVDGYYLEKVDLISKLSDVEAEDAMDITQMFQVLDAAGTLGTAADVAKLGRSLAHTNSVTKALERAGQTEMAADASIGAAQSPVVAQSLGTTREASVMSLLNTSRSSELFQGQASGVAETAAEITGQYTPLPKIAALRNELSELVNANASLQPVIATKSEIQHAIDVAAKDFQKELKSALPTTSTPPPKVTVERLTEDMSSGFGKVRLNAGDQSKEVEIVVGKNSWGTIESMKKADNLQFSTNLQSPKLRMRSADDNSTTVNRLIEDAGIVDVNQEKMRRTLQDAYMGVRKYVGDTKNVDELLDLSDRQNKILTPDEIMSHNKDITPKEMDGYYLFNEMLDITGDMADHINYTTARRNNIKEMTLFTDKMAFGKVYDNLDDSAVKSLNTSGLTSVERFLDVDTGKHVLKSDLDNYLDKSGKQLAVLDEDHLFKSTNTRERAVIVPREAVGDVRPKSFKIHRRSGYIPRIRPDAKYFVKEVVRSEVNGVPVDRLRTYAASSSKELAEQSRLNRAIEIDEKGLDIKVEDYVRYDREGRTAFADGTEGLTEGTFYGHRATHEIDWLDTYAEATKPASEAIADNLMHISGLYATNDWKMAMVNRWVNSVEAAGYQPHNGVINLHTPISKVEVGEAGAELRQLEDIRQELATLTGIPDTASRHWEELTKYIADFVDGKFGKNKMSTAVGRGLRRAGNLDPVSQLKYYAFSTLLGWFNPAQLFVQAQNMSVAASIHPWLTATHMRKSMALRAVLFDHTGDSSVAFANKLMTTTAEELEDLRVQFLRSGLDVVQNNADLQAASMGLGTTRNAFRKANDAGLVFYRQGELAARTVAYTVAREDYLRSTRTTWDKLTDSDHRLIRDRAVNLTLNMGRENRAMWQKSGLLALPTQFWQVQAKFIEAFMGEKFTLGQKLRLLAGQGVIYGAAGLPFGDQIVEGVARMFGDGEPGQDSPVSTEVWRQGMLGFLAGGELELSARGGIANQMTEQLMALFDQSRSSRIEDLFGASATVFSRSSYAGSMLASFVVPKDGIPEKDMINAIRAVASIASTGNNIDRAYTWWKLERAVNNRNETLFDDPSLTEIFGKGLGFQAVRETAIYDMVKDQNRRAKWKKDIVDGFFRHYYNAGVDASSIEFADQFGINAQAYAHAITDNEYERNQIVASIFRKLNTGDSKLQKEAQKMFKNSISDQFNPIIEQLAEENQ
jgi:hypothetical protein